MRRLLKLLAIQFDRYSVFPNLQVTSGHSRGSLKVFSYKDWT